MLLRKGVYPYEYKDNWERFDETSLPDKESFYSSLNMENIDDIDYRHGNNVFKKFKLKKFRRIPRLIRICIWGICHSIHRYAKVNNKYMKKYNKNEESSYIQYLDANILYGWAMSQKLPVNDFKWINNVSKINEKFIKNYDEDSDKGYIIEVDVNYPKRLHDLHSDLPFLPERMKIDKCKKLVCNLHDKKRYVLHIRSLKQALDYGLKLEKIHKVIEFNQKPWLKPYIDLNTELRKIAKKISLS